MKFKDDNKTDELNQKIDIKYKKLSQMNLEELKTSLKELQENHIYDYEKTNKNYRLFTSLYEKKEAIDFLLSKVNKSENDQSDNKQDISVLYDRIDPTNRTITIKNIQDTEACIKIFNKFKELNNNSQIFEYIKNELKDNDISKFEIFSKNYSSIIELDRNEDTSINLYKEVDDYIKNATFIFRQDNEDFTYGEKGITNMEKLIHLKNKIHIKPPKDKKEPQDEFQKKCFKLVYFKELISDLEVI